MRTTIILIFILTLAATIGTIVVGSRSFEGIVVDKPYETGLAWDDIRKNRESLGWTVAVQGGPFRTGPNDLSLDIAGKGRAPLADAVVLVTISRPSTRQYDRTYATILQGPGRYHAEVELPFYGNWDVTVDVAQGNDRTTFRHSLFAEQGRR